MNKYSRPITGTCSLSIPCKYVIYVLLAIGRFFVVRFICSNGNNVMCILLFSLFLLILWFLFSCYWWCAKKTRKTIFVIYNRIPILRNTLPVTTYDSALKTVEKQEKLRIKRRWFACFMWRFKLPMIISKYITVICRKPSSDSFSLNLVSFNLYFTVLSMQTTQKH